MIDDLTLALLVLLPRTRPVARLLRLLVEVEAADSALAALPVGEAATLTPGEDARLRVRSRSGKKFALEAVTVRRVE